MKSTVNESFVIETDPFTNDISDITIRKIFRAWQESESELPLLGKEINSENKELILRLIADCIKEEGGEISRRAKALHLAVVYIQLSKKGKGQFLRILARDFDVDLEMLDSKMQNLKNAKIVKTRILSELQLRDSLIPPRVKLLRQFITLPNGFIFLKDMRQDLLPMTKINPRIKKLSEDIKLLLTTYFDVNLLDLAEITWNSPAALLEKLMDYEAVHEITTWRALKHRLYTDHRVFAFFHNKMPNEPLIFVEVALVKGMSDNIQKLISTKEKPENPLKADTAIFYSISSTQKGLEGISFGNFLIKRVVKKLSTDYPNLKEFATLSPIPLFRNWLAKYLSEDCDSMLNAYEKKELFKITEIKNENEGLLKILNTPNWYKNKETTEAIKKPLMRLCAHFLFHEKRRNTKSAYDPVANFHLSNGAKIEHIHWLADASKKGIAQSAGIMLNYHYRLDKININHEEYMTNGKIHASSDAKSWLR